MTEMIPIALIDDSDRIRPVNQDWAAVMAEDLAAGVLLPPIVIRPVAPGEAKEGCEWGLVIGGHRMAAHRLAGLTEIRADIEPLSRDEALIREADENLKRHNPTALDRGLFLLIRKTAHDRLHPQTTRGGDRRSTKWKSLPFDGAVTFAREAADKLGLSERTIRADIALAAALAPAAIALIRETDLVDNAQELKRIATHEPDEQVRLSRRIASGEARSYAQARVVEGLDKPLDRDPQEQIFTKLVELYGRANARTKRRFEEHADLVRSNARSAGTSRGAAA